MMTRMDVWDPFKEIMTLREAMDRLFEESFVPVWRSVTRVRREGADGGDRVLYLPVDVYETDNEIVVTASLPGLKPEDVEITFEDGSLTIRGEVKPPLEGVNYLICERAHGPFARTLNINVPVEADKIEANFENGLLTVTIPKAESVRPKTIKVKAK